MDELTLREVISETELTERNVKYWTSMYDLEVIRRGRKNFYPRRTVDILRVIGELSRLQIFTSNFVRWLVDMAMDRSVESDERFIAYRKQYDDLSERLGMDLPIVPGIVSKSRTTSGSLRSPSFKPRQSEFEDDALL